CVGEVSLAPNAHQLRMGEPFSLTVDVYDIEFEPFVNDGRLTLSTRVTFPAGAPFDIAAEFGRDGATIGTGRVMTVATLDGWELETRFIHVLLLEAGAPTPPAGSYWCGVRIAEHELRLHFEIPG